ncbi:hypothetical protein PG291_09605 [Riemerella anatipestifer]|nr:hypothetical protein [Riemerella anatipestifer]
MKITQIPLDKQVTYRLDLTMKVPHEVYINDILVAQKFRNSNAGIDLNPYILKNGKYVVKLRLLPFSQYNEKLISRKDIENTALLFGSYIMDKESGKLIRSNVDKLLPITVPKTDVPYFEQEWEVEITELPYELEGWSNGQDLRKWDQKELEKKVVAYYKKLWDILNNGEDEKWIDITMKRISETSVFYYESEKENQRAISENKKNIIKYCKHNMIPLEDYEMKIYAEGKIVTLVRKTHTKEFNNYSRLDIKGWSPLIRKGEKAGAADYGIKLYLPKNSDEFVIIRK